MLFKIPSDFQVYNFGDDQKMVFPDFKALEGDRVWVSPILSQLTYQKFLGLYPFVYVKVHGRKHVLTGFIPIPAYGHNKPFRLFALEKATRFAMQTRQVAVPEEVSKWGDFVRTLYYDVVIQLPFAEVELDNHRYYINIFDVVRSSLSDADL